MRRKPEEVRVTVTPDGRITTEGLSNHSPSFQEFVRSVEPAYLNTMFNDSRQVAGQSDEESLRAKARRGQFSIHKRKDKFHFGFGFDSNYEYRLESLVSKLYRGSMHAPTGELLTAEDKLVEVLKQYPTIYELAPNERGERIFCYPRFSDDKTTWPQTLGEVDVIVVKRPKLPVQNGRV